MEPSLWIAAQVRNLYPGSNPSGLLWPDGHGGLLLGVGDREGVGRVFSPKKIAQDKGEGEARDSGMGNRKKSQGKQCRKMTAATNIPWIGLVWQVGLLTLFTYHRDSKVIIASLMNLSCAIVLLFFYLKIFFTKKVCGYCAYTVKKSLSVFPSPFGMSLTKLSLHGQE